MRLRTRAPQRPRRAALLVVAASLGAVVGGSPVEGLAGIGRAEYVGRGSPVPPAAGEAAWRRPREYRSLSKVTDPRDSRGPLDIAAATFGQKGRELVIGLRTHGRWNGADLAADPRRALCVYLSGGRLGAAGARICVGRSRGAAVRLRLEALDPAGTPLSSTPLRANIRRPDGRSLHGRVLTSRTGLARGRYSWQVGSSWVDDRACAAPPEAPAPCADRAPDQGSPRFRLARVRPRGCLPRRPARRLSGARNRKLVAITFDDGPGPYTPRILRVLKRNHVPATFFLVGEQIRGRERLVRRMLRERNAVANHSFNHANLAGGGPGAYRQLAASSSRIRHASGFTPCLFRPPYGAVSDSLVSEALRLGMMTIMWDVDPRDWSRPGAGAIRGRVLGGVRRGSVVVMHDGGGSRAQTLSALPSILAGLRARGYRFVTVPELLSLREIYG